MAVHTIMLLDRLYGDEPRSVIRDDVAGTVEGTHSDVPGMRRTLARPTPVNYSSDERVLYLHNPAHDPAEFLWLIRTAFNGILYAPLRSILPPVFDGVELSPMEPAPRAARRPRCRWQSHRISRQQRTDRVRHLPQNLTPMARAGLAARLQARCKPVARRMHGACKAPAGRLRRQHGRADLPPLPTP